MALSSEKHLVRLQAREEAEKRKLAAQRKTLQAVQNQQRHEQRKLVLARQREIGRLAYDAGLGTVDLDVLRAAFRQLACDLGVGTAPGGTTPEVPAHPEGQHGAQLTTQFPLRDTRTPATNAPEGSCHGTVSICR